MISRDRYHFQPRARNATGSRNITNLRFETVNPTRPREHIRIYMTPVLNFVVHRVHSHSRCKSNLNNEFTSYCIFDLLSYKASLVFIAKDHTMGRPTSAHTDFRPSLIEDSACNTISDERTTTWLVVLLLWFQALFHKLNIEGMKSQVFLVHQIWISELRTDEGTPVSTQTMLNRKQCAIIPIAANPVSE